MRLAKRAGKSRTLLVLDGIEPLQKPPGGDDGGKLTKNGLAEFLIRLARSNDGLCVITSRQKLTDLAEESTERELHINLENLDRSSGADLLSLRGVNGPRKELKKASKEFGGHALALNLLGTYLHQVHGGDVSMRSEIEQLLDKDDKYGGHAIRVMRSYEKWYRTHGRLCELNALMIMGLFDREATIGEIEAVLVNGGQKTWRWAGSGGRLKNGALR